MASATTPDYLRARYYDPGTGQFVSRDPITGITRQPYSLVSDDPLNQTDPSGLAGLGPVTIPIDLPIIMPKDATEAPFAAMHSMLLNDESIASTGFYAPY